MRRPKLKGKQERTGYFFRIFLLLLLLSLWFLASLSSFFSCLVQESTVNDSLQYDFYDEGRYSEIGIMKTRRIVYQRKNTWIGSSFLVSTTHLFYCSINKREI